MSALNQIATARDPQFAARIAMIALKVAQNVASESPATANHAERIAYANRILRGDENPKMLAAHAIASNGSAQAAIESDPGALGANIPDGDIEFIMATIWDARAIAFAP